MKRNSAAIFIMLAAGMLSANAQDKMGLIYDGMDWSENDYGGSSRTMGMGNAVTALGGDLGSFQFNPAGSAVATYSQVGVTMGASVSMTTTQGTTDVGMPQKPYLLFGNPCDRTRGKFIFPNGGFSLRFDTGNSTGLKRFTFGFTANAVNVYNCETYASGKNNISSYAGFVGDFATNSRFTPADLEKYNVDYMSSTLYNARIIGHVPEYTGGNLYAGTTENIYKDEQGYWKELGGKINQQDKRNISGSKMDYLINFGFDISDIVYFGVNLGITNLNYKVQDVISEQANDVALEGIITDNHHFDSGFKSFTYNYSYQSSGTGLYGKFGVIVTPVDGLRIGAAIQTPTRLRISETVMHSASHTFDDHGFSSANSPRSNWIYDISTPMRFNLGLAYTIGGMAIISADYERVDFRSMRFHPYYGEDQIWFDGVNDVIQGLNGPQYLRAQNMVRVGAEVKPIPEIAIRAGYNFANNGLANIDETVYEPYEDTHAFTLGLGYDSPGAFFCDIAAKMSYQPSSTIQVYDNYVWDEHDNLIGGPVTTSTRRLLNIVGTIGWRF